MTVVIKEKPPFDFESLEERFTGRLRRHVDLSKTNWFRVGGLAEALFKPDSAEDLAQFFMALPSTVPVTVLGVGSNVIVRDGGIPGVVIKLGRGLADIVTTIDSLEAGAGALCLSVSAFARDHSIAKLEFLCGVPGTIGGAVAMNAGAYGSDVSRVLVGAEIVERNGRIHRLSNVELRFSYRHSAVPEGAVVTKAIFQKTPGNAGLIARQMETIQEARAATQPIRTRTGGSTFKNPEGHKAWELIEKAGCRGLSIGGAQVSEKHCNFLINTGDATAQDLEMLGEEVRRRVHESSGIMLEWEIKRVGVYHE